LPLGGIAAGVENGEDHNAAHLNRKINSIREAFQQRAPNARPEMGILKRPFDDTVVSRSELIQLPILKPGGIRSPLIFTKPVQNITSRVDPIRILSILS
jgi:hypothetical protein